MLPALLAVIEHGVPPSSLTRDSFAELMALVLRIGEINRRVNILQTLPSSVNIAIASDYLPACLKDRPNIRYAGYVDDFDEIRGLMRNARMVLNATSKFPAGSTTVRIAEGADVLSDLSVVMKQDSTDREYILYLPQHRLAAGDLDDIATTIKDDARLRSIADNARIVYAARHSWIKRAPLLAEAMRAA